jgi:hypothetical protein
MRQAEDMRSGLWLVIASKHGAIRPGVKLYSPVEERFNSRRDQELPGVL